MEVFSKKNIDIRCVYVHKKIKMVPPYLIWYAMS
jgi:hypothetical protein